MLQMKKWVLAFKIEYLWKRIQCNRKRMELLIRQHVPYSSPKLVRLDERNREFGWRARQMEKLWMQMPSK
ncbi:hypothetical protein [Marasmitruncus massiliensis]|jgi:hypothetical protein|uniref:hypothetical protein n=1 Tax=Marasmitruncus massiliensis TaxID=1944642 RepID=UPI000C7DB0E3|nr:hypothetical protein [Marasmitruncus massiliensis]MBE6907935.1 hypothetical protein [Oscillospiraceae bacterium]